MSDYWREQVTFWWDDVHDDDVHFVLDQQSAGRHVDPLGHIILIPSQPIFVLFLLLRAVYFAEKQLIPIL